MKGAREPSMEDILASIKKVIAEEKEIRAGAATPHGDLDPDVLELDEPVGVESAPTPPVPPEPPADLGEPLASEQAVGSSRERLAALQEAAAAAPPRPQVNPFEAMVRDMVRPLLKEWLDAHLPDIVDEHVRREIGRITGTPL